MSISSIIYNPEILSELAAAIGGGGNTQQSALTFSKTYSVAAGGSTFPLIKFPFAGKIDSGCYTCPTGPPNPAYPILSLDINGTSIGGLQNSPVPTSLYVQGSAPPNTFAANDTLNLFLITADGTPQTVDLTLNVFYTSS